MGADVIIDPDADTADEIMELAHVSGPTRCTRCRTVSCRARCRDRCESSPFVGHDLAEIGRSFEPDWRFLFGALTRDGETVIPRGDQVSRPATTSGC
jgi:trk system potassium uptake protein TrkA